MSLKRFLQGGLLTLGAVAVLSGGMSAMQGTPVAAASKYTSCNKTVFGVPAWYNNIAQKDADGNCNIVSPKDLDAKNGIQIFILRIAVNSVTLLLMLAGYVCVIFVIYGGFKYFFSAGSSDGMSKAKQTILNAFIGLVISFLSVGIINAVFNILSLAK